MEAVLAVFAACALVAWSSVWVLVGLTMLDVGRPKPVPVRVKAR